MYLTTLQLNDFRNFKGGLFNFKPGLNFIVAPNTYGKTNILEAIYFLVIFQSFRNKELRSLIRENSTTANFEVGFKKENDDKEQKLWAVLDFGSSKVVRKALKLNGVKKQPHQIMGEFQVVLFTPQDLNLVCDDPSSRRHFIDVLISKINPLYYRNLLNYKRVIHARNRLLYLIQIGRAEMKELDFWDKQFLSLAEFLVQERMSVLRKINQQLKEVYPRITDAKDLPAIDYQTSFEYQDNLKESLTKKLNEVRAEEIDSARTIFGPHRDDLVFKLNNKKLALYGSRGEQRSVILALKISELSLIEKKIGESPILLLDDVLSELDHKRQTALLEALDNLQVIVTTTEIDHLKQFNHNRQVNLIELKK